MKSNFYKQAAVLALITAGISGFSNFINKFAVSAVKDPVFYTAIKNGFVAIALVGLILALGQWRSFSRLSVSQATRLVLVGLIGGAIPFALFFIGLSQTSAINASLIHKTLFVWVAILASLFLKEKFTAWQWAGVAVIFSANLFVGGFKGFAWSGAELMILCATLLWAVENIIAKPLLAELPVLTVAASRMFFGTLFLAPVVIWRGGSLSVFTGLSATQWGWTLVAAGLLLAYVSCWYGALRAAPASFVSALLVPATLVTNMLSALFITHSVDWQFLTSAALFVLGAGLVIVFPRRIATAEPITIGA